MAEEIPADTTLVQCFQPNQSPHVVDAAAAGEVGGSADLRPGAAAVTRYHRTATAAAEAAAIHRHHTVAVAEAAAVQHHHAVAVLLLFSTTNLRPPLLAWKPPPTACGSTDGAVADMTAANFRSSNALVLRLS